MLGSGLAADEFSESFLHSTCCTLKVYAPNRATVARSGAFLRDRERSIRKPVPDIASELNSVFNDSVETRVGKVGVL